MHTLEARDCDSCPVYFVFTAHVGWLAEAGEAGILDPDGRPLILLFTDANARSNMVIGVVAVH